MKKRILCLMLAFAMTLPLYVHAAAAEKAYSGYEKDYEALTALGFIDSADGFDADKELTRGEAARYIVRISGAPLAEKSGASFSDVSSSNENYEYINTAASRKYISGTGENMFCPNDKIKPLDFAIGLMNVLGYSEIGTIAGYSDGWQGLANRLKLTDGMSAAQNLSGADAVRMMMTALECEPVKLDAVGDVNYYKAEAGVTLLEDAHDIIKARGIVDGDAYTSMYEPEGSGSGFCTIDGAVYLADDVDATALFGRCVDYYYKETDDDAYRRLLYASEYRNSELVLNYDEIGEVSKDSVETDGENIRAKKYRISKAASFIYNYKQQPIAPELMKPKYGTVTLVDNNSDGYYEVVIVKEYLQMKVDYVSAKTGNIIGADGTVIEIDPDAEFDYVVYNGGAKVTSSAVAADMTLNYLISDGAGRNIIEMRISRDKIEAAAAMIDEDSIVIDDTLYKVSPYFDFTGVNMGTYYTWYIDCDNVVSFAAFDKIYVYGYLNWMYKDEMDDNVHMKIYTENARWVELTLREKIRYNGTGGVLAESVYEGFGEIPQAYRQMIAYKVNGDGQIIELNTAKSYDAWSAGERAAIEKGEFRVRKFNNMYRTSIDAFGTDVYLSGKKLIFFVPEQGENGNREDEFYIGSTNNLVQDQTYSGLAYDCDGVGGAPVIMVDSKYLSSTPVARSEIMVVKKVTATVNDDNEKIYNIKGMYKGYEVEINTSPNAELNNIEGLEFGDVIQYITNPKGELSAFSLKFDCSKNLGAKNVFNGAAYHIATIAGGEVYNIDASKNMMVFDSASKGMYTFLSGCIYYLVDTGNREMKATDFSDVIRGRYMVIKAEYFRVREVVIYI